MTHKIIDQELFDNRKLLSKEIKEDWLNALRSGKFKKGKGNLCINEEYCCLGVFMEINGYKSEIERGGDSEIGNLDIKRYYGKDTLASSIVVLISEPSIAQYFTNVNGNFSGFSIDINGFELLSLVALNDFTHTFDEVIQVIEKFF